MWELDGLPNVPIALAIAAATSDAMGVVAL